MNAALAVTPMLQTFAAEIDAEGILFDMDGVLVCSTGGDERCWMRWAEHHKLQLGVDPTLLSPGAICQDHADHSRT